MPRPKPSSKSERCSTIRTLAIRKADHRLAGVYCRQLPPKRKTATRDLAMHPGDEKEVANLKQKAQQLLKTSVRIDNLFPHERDCRNGKAIARPSGRAGSSSQQTQQTPRGSNSNERNLTRKSEPTSNERRKGRKWRFHHKAGRNEKAVPLSFFTQTNGPKLK